MDLPTEMFVVIVASGMNGKPTIYSSAIEHCTLKHAKGIESRLRRDICLADTKIGRLSVIDSDQIGYKGPSGKNDIDEVIVDLIEKYDRLLDARFDNCDIDIANQKAKIKTRLLEWVGNIGLE